MALGGVGGLSEVGEMGLSPISLSPTYPVMPVGLCRFFFLLITGLDDFVDPFLL